MRVLNRAAGLACVVALAAAGAPAHGQELGSAQEIVSCVSDNVPRGDDLRSIKLVTRDRAGTERTIRANVFGRRTAEGHVRLVVRFSEPADLDDSAMLIVGTDSGPEVTLRTLYGEKQISAGQQATQALFGTGMSYEDFLYLLGSVRSEAAKQERLDDALVADTSVYVLESNPAPGTSAYARILTSIDKKTCVPLRIQLYERSNGGEPRKVFTSNPSQIFRVGKTWIPHAVLVRDLRDSKETELVIETVNPLPRLPDEFFNPAGLGRYIPKIEITVELEEIEPMPIEPMPIEIAPLQ